MRSMVEGYMQLAVIPRGSALGHVPAPRSKGGPLVVG